MIAGCDGLEVSKPSEDSTKAPHHSSIYKQPARMEKEGDYRRREVANNPQAINRLKSARLDFLLGLGGGIDLYAYDAKRQISLVCMQGLGILGI